MESEDPKLPASLLAKAFGVRCIAWLGFLVELSRAIRGESNWRCYFCHGPSVESPLTKRSDSCLIQNSVAGALKQLD
jgi:hypothetical protein